MSGKREHEKEGRVSRREGALVLIVIIVIGYFTYPIWSTWFPHVPVTEQGLKLSGTVNYANNTAVTTQTTMFVDKATRTTAYTAAIAGGAFTTNRGPIDGGTYIQYISISGCMLFVREVTVPVAKEFDHEIFTVDPAVIYTNAAATGWSALVTAGSVANSFTGGGSAATSNYSASAGSAVTFDLKLTLATDYAKLFKQYTDPFDEDSEDGTDIPLKPILWIEIGTAAGVYATGGSNTRSSWTAGSVTYIIMELEQLTSPTSVDVSAYFDMKIVASSAAELTFKVYILDGSNLDYLSTAKAKVAHPDSGETIASHNLVDAYLLVT